MTFKFFQVLKRSIISLLIFIAGVILLIAPYDPGRLSNFFAWLETDGRIVSLFVGASLIVLATVSLVISLHSISNPFRIVHGKLTCLIEKNLIKGLIEQILGEFFEDKTLHAEVTLKRGTLHLLVEVPPGRTDLDSFSEYLRDRLFLLAGYYGDICLSTRVKTSPSLQEFCR